MFRMLGNKVELTRYKVTYIEDETEYTENCISDHHKAEFEQILSNRGLEFSTTPVDQTDNEWINGLNFQSYDEAKAAIETGEQAYLQNKRRQEAIDNLQLRADIDFLSAMAGVEL